MSTFQDRPNWRITLQSNYIKVLEKKLKHKEQECESLKSAFSLDTKMLERTEKRESDLEKQLNQLKAENSKLKQALEDIEKSTIEQFCDYCEDIGPTELTYQCEYCEYGEIFDIINKAKEQE